MKRGRTLQTLVLLLLMSAPLLAVTRPPRDDEAQPTPSAVSAEVSALQEARVAREEGRPREAAEALEPLREGALAAHVERLRATWLRESGDLEAARDAAALGLDRAPPSELRAALQHELARVELERGDLLSGYRAFRDAWESTRERSRAAGLSLEAARAFDAQGLPGDAIRLYRQTWMNWPTREEADQAYDRERTLRDGTGAEPPGAGGLLRRAGQLRGAYQCERALPIYQEVRALPALDTDLRRRAEVGYAACLFQRRRYHEAEQFYRALVKADPADDELAIQLGRTLARQGKTVEGVKVLSEVARRTDPKTRTRARYLVAVLLRERDPGSSARLLRKVEKSSRRPDLARGARWRLAWEDYQERRFRDAVGRLSPLTRGSIWDIEVQRARYWRAVSQIELGGEAREKGRAELEVLREKLPLSYYGLRAADRLHDMPEAHRAFLPERGAGTDGRPAELAQVLVQGGFPESARDEMESWMRAGKRSREDRVLAAEVFHAVGDHARAVRLVVDGFGGSLEQGVDPAWREVWTLAWPRPFEPGVRDATAEFDGDPNLVYAIMREESHYQPDAESPAGARGLMQVMPPTATVFASSLGVEGFDPESLFQPLVNVRLGTGYLEDMIGRFGGSKPMAIAAYNAGPEAVERWREHNGALEADEFVESVPYLETRTYLRRVLRSYRMYELLYGGAQRDEVPGR